MMEKELEAKFREDLAKLLKKYNAEIHLSQRGLAYMEYEVIEVSVLAKYDPQTNEQLTPDFDFDL